MLDTSQLSKLKRILEEQSGNFGVVNIGKYIEGINPPLSDDSKGINESDKTIFKERVSSENAKAIINLVNNTDEYTVENLSEYKRKIINKGNIMITIGENPVEMIVYATKGLYGRDIYKNAVSDAIKSIFEEKREDVVKAYSNILRSWTWTDCLEFVLKSTADLKIWELAANVYSILEKNPMLRELSAKVLISLGAENYYSSMVNYLCNLPNSTSADITIIKNVFYTMGKQGESTVNILFNAYIKYNMNKDVSGIIATAIKYNITHEILERCDKYLRNSNTDRAVERKVIYLLGRCAAKNENEKAINILRSALKYPYTNKTEINMALIGTDAGITGTTVVDVNMGERERIKALISLGRDNTLADIEKTLDEVSKESEVLKIAAYSIRVEKKEYNYMIKLFEYIANRDEYDEASLAATNQIKRLRRVDDRQLITNLQIIAEKMLENDDLINVKKVLKIIDIFQSGIPNDDVAMIFNKKLNTTVHFDVKKVILDFYKRQYCKFSSSVQATIRQSIIKCTHDEDVQEIAMDCLRVINEFNDFTPIV